MVQLGLALATLGILGMKKWAQQEPPNPVQRYQQQMYTSEQMYLPTAEDVALAMLVEQYGDEHGIYVAQDSDVEDTNKSRAAPYRLH